uniref:Uncharacterized protein n=1 Tax=Tanacetum cinerariifolium TaxID=118510 RepID=A0A6L2N8Z3_TANCI|nr:hypothetical protein [Tanacetum cinerariifolium]
MLSSDGTSGNPCVSEREVNWSTGRSMGQHVRSIGRFGLSRATTDVGPHGIRRGIRVNCKTSLSLLSWSSRCAPTSKNSSSSTAMVAAGVVTREATGEGTIKDASEIGNEADDHSDLELCPTLKVLGTGPFARSRARRLAALYPKPIGSSAVVPQPGLPAIADPQMHPPFLQSQTLVL